MNLSQPTLERSDVPAEHFRGVDRSVGAFERKACAPMCEDQVHLARLAERRGERFLSRPAQRAHLALRVPSSQSNSALLLAFLTEEEFAVPLWITLGPGRQWGKSPARTGLSAYRKGVIVLLLM